MSAAHTIIVASDESLSCPHCHREYPIRDALSSKTLDHYQAEHDAYLARERSRLRDEATSAVERDLAQRHAEQLSEMETKLKAQLAESEKQRERMTEEKGRLEQSIKDEFAFREKSLQEELKQKSDKVQALQTQELELRRERKVLEEKQQELELQVQRRIDAQTQKVRQEIDEANKLREAEHRKQLEDALRANDDLKRKLEQGSQQLQGEVLELEIETLLAESFPLDRIDEIAKGQRGADVHQTVFTHTGAQCGEILWEMKRAQKWSGKWLEKLKSDQRAAGAEIAILVTTAFPEETDEQFIFYEDVWITRPSAVRSLALALRAGLIESSRQKLITANRDEKMAQLYDYLCSAQFAQKVRAVVETYESMKLDLSRERAAMERLWKKREQQLSAMTTNMMGLTGEIQAIAQDGVAALSDLGALEEDDE